MDYEQAAFWWNVLLTIAMSVIGLYAWITARQKANRETIDEVDIRVVRLEEQIKHMPRKSDMDTLHGRITEVAEVQKRMEGEMHQINHTLRLINDFLIKQGS